MSESPPLLLTFVIRFHLEHMASGTRWRGFIEHIPSGEHRAFLGLDGLLMFLQRFGICLHNIEDSPFTNCDTCKEK
jgi:hypothetical protein